MGRRRRTRQRRGQRGQAYVEFIIVLPVFLLLILAILEFGFFWWSRMVVSTATYDTARHVARGGTIQEARAIYAETLSYSLGGIANQLEGGPEITLPPGQRSVRVQTDVPYTWPMGLGMFLDPTGAHLKASAFFRLERFFGGPGEDFE